MAAPTKTTSKKYQPPTTKYQPIHIRRYFEIYTGKDLCKVSGLQHAALSKKRLGHRCFPLKLLRTRFFVEHLWTTTSGRAQEFTRKRS